MPFGLQSGLKDLVSIGRSEMCGFNWIGENLTRATVWRVKSDGKSTIHYSKDSISRESGPEFRMTDLPDRQTF